MPIKTIIVSIVAVAISLVGATYRFGDSGHVVGTLGIDGGKVRHPVRLDPGLQRYVLIVTGIVQPPYRGNARVVLEGEPQMDYEIHTSHPVIDLGIYRRPHFVDGVLEGLQPKDKFALWIVMRPRDPQQFAETDHGARQHAVIFRDTETGQSLLRVPVTYQCEEDSCHAEQD